MENIRKTVFVVDDNLMILSMAKKILETQYKVFTMSSGEKLFKMLEKIIPALIILDVEMPVMNGYEVIKELKIAEKFKNIPVIFMTGSLDAEREEIGRNLGAVDFLSKPFSKNGLLELVQHNI